MFKVSVNRSNRLVIAAIAATATMAIGVQAHAAYSWANSSGGDFGTSTNWSPNGVPTAAATVNFNLTPNPYTVTFSANQASHEVDISSGSPTWDLGGHTYSINDVASANVYIGGGASGSSATPSASNGTVQSNNTYIGYLAGNTDTVTVGAPSTTSTWNIATGFQIGTSGTGTMNVTNGATGMNGDIMYLGYNAGGNGTFSASGEGTTWNSGQMIVGTSGTGSLTVSNGATVTSSSAVLLGRYSGSLGNTLQITGGGKLSGTSLTVGYSSGSTGTATISGAGSSWTGAAGNNSAVGNIGGGTGTLTIENGGAFSQTTGNNLVVGPTGTLKLGGSSITAGALQFNTSGTLEISHTSNTLTGKVNLASASTTIVHLASDSDYGSLTAGGKISFAGTLNVVLDGGYHPSAGDTYTLFQLNGGAGGTFSTINLPTLSQGLSWNDTNVTTTGVISVVPEPASLGLLAIGGLLMLRRRRRHA